MTSPSWPRSDFVISLVGTTSGGKSTLANLLAGRRLLPVGVQETTTAVTEITHDPVQHAASVLSDGRTRKAFSTDEACCSWILNAMTGETRLVSVVAALEIGSFGWASQTHLIRLLGRRPLSPLGLSSRTSLVVRDLPGVQRADDELRLGLLRSSWNLGTTTICVFNSEETDIRKEQQMLGALADGLRADQVPLDSMVFVLNRADSFRRDATPEAALAESIRQRTAVIRAAFGRPDKAESKIVIVPLSAAAALVVELLRGTVARHSSAERSELLRRLASWASQLLPEEVLDLLPRRVDHWRRSQRAWVGQMLMERSGYPQLLMILRGHVRRFESGDSDLRACS